MLLKELIAQQNLKQRWPKIRKSSDKPRICVNHHEKELKWDEERKKRQITENSCFHEKIAGNFANFAKFWKLRIFK